VVVPKGVQLEKPLYVRIAVTGQTFWRMVVVAEEGARASIIEEYASPSEDTEAYSNAVTELFVEQNAKLEYVSLQNLSTETWHFAAHRARVERDAELDWVAGGFGSKRGKTRIQNRSANCHTAGINAAEAIRFRVSRNPDEGLSACSCPRALGLGNISQAKKACTKCSLLRVKAKVGEMLEKSFLTS